MAALVPPTEGPAAAAGAGAEGGAVPPGSAALKA